MSMINLRKYLNFCEKHDLDSEEYYQTGGVNVYNALLNENGEEPSKTDFLTAHWNYQHQKRRPACSAGRRK